MDDPMDIDSSFYGDSDTVQSLQERVDKFDAEAYLRTPPSAPRAIQAGEVKAEEGSVSGDPSKVPPSPPKTRLHNPYAGIPYAWQLSETVDNFLDRLPPSTTDATLECPWIYICNPFVGFQGRSEALPRGCEDEGPQRPGANVALFVEGANERLHLFDVFRSGPTAMPTSSSRNGSQLLSSHAVYAIKKERGEVVADIAALARNLGVTCGKWLLFPEPDEVDEIWAVVARATARGELGVAAKVAPKPVDGMMEGGKAARLVCVYTADFGNVKDVGRVLLKLKELGLLPASRRQIYYKTDAYTYLGIAGGNKWEIKASLYSSDQVFGLVGKR